MSTSPRLLHDSFGSYIPYENMEAFAALRGFFWLMPPQSLIASVLLVVALAWSVATLSLARHEPGDTTATSEEPRGFSHSKYATGRTGQGSRLIEMR